MRHDQDSKTKLTTPDYRRTRTGHVSGIRDQDTGFDMNLQSHIGRSLRHVYEPELSSSLPPEMLSLLRQLDDIPSGGPRS